MYKNSTGDYMTFTTDTGSSTYKSFVSPSIKSNVVNTSNLYFKKRDPQLINDGDVTIYINELGKKTVVRRKDDEPFDLEKAACYAILKSLGVKPSFVNRLVDNHTDTKAIRIQKQLRKERRKSLIQQQEERDEYEYKRLLDDMLTL